MTERYDFPNDKFTKLLCLFSVVEAYGLIYPSPSGENSSFACKTVDLEWTFKHQVLVTHDNLFHQIEPLCI